MSTDEVQEVVSRKVAVGADGDDPAALEASPVSRNQTPGVVAAPSVRAVIVARVVV